MKTSEEMYWAVLSCSKERTVQLHRCQKRERDVMCPRLGELQGVRQQVEEHNKGDTEETIESPTMKALEYHVKEVCILLSE